MDKLKIKEALKNIFEAKVPGVDKTNSVKKQADKINKDYYKDVSKKMADYNKSPEDGTDPVKGELASSEEEIVKNVKGGKALQHIEYDLEPSESFKDRAAKAIKGDSTMGNEVHTGEDNGNTESVWGASNDELGQEVIDQAKDLKQKTDDTKLNLVQFGDDIEMIDGKKPATKKIAVESVDNKTKENKKMKSKKFVYKKEFNGVKNAIKLIPESYKIDGYKFQMTDGYETFDIKWDGSLNEGEAVVFRSANKKLISEDIKKMNHLFNYDTKKASKGLTKQDKINENNVFLNLLNESKSLLTEDAVNLNPKEKSILSDILGEMDGSMDYDMNDLDEQSLTEGLDFNKVSEKVLGYAKKGLLTTALVAALFSSVNSFSQEQKAQLAQTIEQTSGVDMGADFENFISGLEKDYDSKIEKQRQPIENLNFGKFAEFGDKYFSTKETNYNNKGGVIYKIEINHPLYKGKKDTMRNIVKNNYKLKEKYGNVTFEFYSNGGKVGAFQI